MSPTNLANQGFRFTFRPGAGWNWRQEVADEDIDATDMTDEQFVQAVQDAERTTE